jgi:hypothetical protein
MKITRRQLRRLVQKELMSEATRPTGGVHEGDTVWMSDGSHPLKGRVSGKHKDYNLRSHVISVVWYNEDGSMAGQSRHIPSALTTSPPPRAVRQPAAQAVTATDNEDVRMHLSTLNGMGLNADNILDSLRQEVYTTDALDVWLESQPQIPSWPLLRNWLDSLGPEEAEDDLQMLIRALHAKRSGNV